MRTPLIAAAAGLLAAASLTACSGSASVSTGGLDVDKLESTVSTQLEEQLDLTEAPTVTCPDSIEQQEGAVTTCTASLSNGDTADIKVTQTDGNGNVDWELVEPSADPS